MSTRIHDESALCVHTDSLFPDASLHFTIGILLLKAIFRFD
jgi:hypothetical protein